MIHCRRGIMILIVDYGMGNIHSVSKALEYVTNEEVVISANPEDLIKASRIVLPGVGAFGEGIASLKNGGWMGVLKKAVLQEKKPFFGICLGMQMLAEESLEHGRYSGLGWIKGNVTRFMPTAPELKIPHVGWNDVQFKKNNPLLQGVREKADFYFVHSFHLTNTEPEIIAATCDYGYPFVAAIKKDNIFATQFHPEKSQQQGLQILKNFCQWKGE